MKPAVASYTFQFAMLNDYGIKSYPAEPKPVRRFLFLVLILTLTVIGLLVLIWWLGRREIR